MIISSPAFSENGEMPDRYAYHGKNYSPPLIIHEVPPEAVTLALICHDPDAPRQNGFNHWLVWNITPIIESIEENSVPPDAVVGENDWGENDWGGPAPPSGTHRYVFYLYALKTLLDLKKDTRRLEFLDIIEPDILETATLTGLYTAK